MWFNKSYSWESFLNNLGGSCFDHHFNCHIHRFRNIDVFVHDAVDAATVLVVFGIPRFIVVGFVPEEIESILRSEKSNVISTSVQGEILLQRTYCKILSTIPLPSEHRRG